MTMLRINATPTGLAFHDTPQPVAKRLRTLVTKPGPVVIMVHGYKYNPGHAVHCPHKKLFGERTRDWPSMLGFGQGATDEGIGVALGWFARGTLSAVHARAAALGEKLASLIDILRVQNPNRPVHVIAHSLGSETALSALGHLPHGAIDRIILLTGASYTQRALEMLETAAGRSAEILNVTSRENDLFDLAFERLVRPRQRIDRAIGQGIEAANVVNIQLDCTHTLSRFRHLGFEVSSPDRRVCHWSAYKRTGVMALYSSFLRSPETMSLEHLKSALPPQTAPRWSRLFAMPRRRLRQAEVTLPLRLQQVSSLQPCVGTVTAGASKNKATC